MLCLGLYREPSDMPADGSGMASSLLKQTNKLNTKTIESAGFYFLGYNFWNCIWGAAICQQMVAVKSVVH